MRKLVDMFKPIWYSVKRFQGLDILRHRGWAGVFVLVAIWSVLGCTWMPPLEEQERHVRDNQLVLHP